MQGQGQLLLRRQPPIKFLFQHRQRQAAVVQNLRVEGLDVEAAAQLLFGAGA